MYAADGGSELCDTLMKYLYKGMAQGTGSSSAAAGGKNAVTPQQTGGFSQMSGRSFGGGAEGGEGEIK